jgi:hypothetical protein
MCHPAWAWSTQTAPTSQPASLQHMPRSALGASFRSRTAMSQIAPSTTTTTTPASTPCYAVHQHAALRSRATCPHRRCSRDAPDRPSAGRTRSRVRSTCDRSDDHAPAPVHRPRSTEHRTQPRLRPHLVRAGTPLGNVRVHPHSPRGGRRPRWARVKHDMLPSCRPSSCSISTAR